ncbi:MAG: hypothetical protein M1824_002779 [Vezdaea acicularis]|nr:MAG: hypothetical protein M1824_002779 [Vezdaea acicularis]
MRGWRLLALLAAATSLISTVAALPMTDEDAQRADEHWVYNESAKYFHEPGGDDYLGHYDARYFKRVVSYDERSDTLHHLVRSYLLWFREKGLETWIAHGTLLGWWWNGKVSGATLDYLGKYENRTTHHYKSEDGTVQRDYLLDVNPHYQLRDRGDGMNVIDARWIDVRTGLFIDITGLSETRPDSLPGVWLCKNYHRYRTRDLFPMRESTYEGVPVKIPYDYDKILMDEYQSKAMVLTEYEGHHWDPATKEWVPNEDNRYDHPIAPHVPNAVQPQSLEPGIGNIWRLLHRS